MLEGKTILVTGATSGIGEAVCQALLAAGASIVAVGRNAERLSVLQQSNPRRVRTLTFDLTRFFDYRATFSDMESLDGLVYSAGIVENNPIRYFSMEKYNRVVDINQTAPIALISELVHAGKLNSGASLVLLSSILGPRIGMKGLAAYAGSKAALTGFAKVLALELAHRSIRVNCISPGMVNTELVSNQQAVSNHALQVDMQRYPLGKRYAEASEVASVVLFLLSGQSSFMTGENIVVDGGYCVQ